MIAMLSSSSATPAPHALPAPLNGHLAEAVLDALGGAQLIVGSDPGRAKTLVDRASELLARLSVLNSECDRLTDTRASVGLMAWQMRKIDRYIADNLYRQICTQDLAHLLDMSCSHFTRQFKASTGLTLQEQVTRLRIARTQAMIRESGAPLSRIALDCGFCDQAHMTRTFHRVVGQTPMAWRRAAQDAAAA